MSVTFVMFFGGMLLLAAAAPRLRLSRMVPVLCLVIGFYFATLGVFPTVHEIVNRLRDFFSQIHLTF